MWGWGLWVAAALLLFWGIGAYNRLVRLRAAVTKAFAALDEQLVRQLVWIQGGVPESLRDGPHTTPGELTDDVTVAWTRLHAASEQFAVALAQARAQPLDVAVMAALVMAHEALRTAWASFFMSLSKASICCMGSRNRSPTMVPSTRPTPGLALSMASWIKASAWRRSLRLFLRAAKSMRAVSMAASPIASAS